MALLGRRVLRMKGRRRGGLNLCMLLSLSLIYFHHCLSLLLSTTITYPPFFEPRPIFIPALTYHHFYFTFTAISGHGHDEHYRMGWAGLGWISR